MTLSNPDDDKVGLKLLYVARADSCRLQIFCLFDQSINIKYITTGVFLYFFGKKYLTQKMRGVLPNDHQCTAIDLSDLRISGRKKLRSLKL